VGIEPSCLLTLRDELAVVVRDAAVPAIARRAVLLEELLVAEHRRGALALVPGLAVRTIESSCCGMAGAFGYEAEHHDISMRMAERSLLPAVRGAPAGALIVADGTSCRHQIADGAGRAAVHVARVLEAALATPTDRGA
ncbi:MAG TPA: hypothetical protein VGD80_30280, partial [Kofleriaceae bacterium]